MVGANFLCFRDNSVGDSETTHDGKYRLNFKIIDNETPNCGEIGGSIVDCVPPASGCTKYKIANNAWDPSVTPQKTYGIQASIDANGIISNDDNSARFFCVNNKYLNNSGHYDVSVKIKRDAKVKVSNFIDSIISPIMEEIDGNNKATTLSYSLLPAVENQILNQDFYKEDHGSVSSGNAFYHDYDYNGNIVYPYFLISPRLMTLNSNLLKNPNIDITNLKTMAGGDPSIVGKKLLTQDFPVSGTASLTLDPTNDDLGGNCGGNSSCFIKYINVAVVASINESSAASPTEVTFKKHCFVRSNRFDTLQQVKMQCANKASCTINFDKTTFPLRVFSIRETDMSMRYKNADLAKIFTQPYDHGSELKASTDLITIPPSPTGISLIDLEKKLNENPHNPFASCNQKTLIVEYIYGKTENPIIKENQVKRFD